MSVSKMKVDEDVLKQFVANLIVAHNLRLKGWISDVLKSDILEHKIYEFAVRQAMEYCYYEVILTLSEKIPIFHGFNTWI